MKKYSNKSVIDSLELPMMTDFNDLVKCLRLSPQLVYWVTSESQEKYQTFKIPKEDGSFREICAPAHSLKIVQRWVLENILYKIKVSPYSFGFIKDGKGSPLVQCAEKHKNNLFILKLDMQNFYPSIHREKVYHSFTTIGYNSCVSNMLTNICTHNNMLPQGAVTSAYLANIVCRNLDYRIAGYCNRRDIVYTRYADDMTFSCDNRDTLKNIYGTIKKILISEDFKINDRKTSFLSPKCHKRILGITVNDNLIKASKELKRIIRAMIHTSLLTGNYSDNQQIRGYIAYVCSIEPNYLEKIKNYILGFYDSQYSVIDEIVEHYNKNKLFPDMPDMKLRCVNDVCKVPLGEEDEYLSAIYGEYIAFLNAHGIIEPKNV